ncbi:MAG: hypothetical protein ACRDQ5_14330, partial [Sciscionella sp.]
MIGFQTSGEVMLAIRLRAVLLVVGILMGISGTAAAEPTAVARCIVHDPRLTELSGLASDGKRWYAINDGGEHVAVFVLDRGCKVHRRITAPLDPYDVEDLALARDGSLWLSDTGDNLQQRDTVAMIKVSPAGKTTLYRLTYSDGPHDAEALLLDRRGTPYIVTKSISGVAGVYTPVGKPSSQGPTAMKQVGTVTLHSTETKGGPIPGFIGSVTVTGGAVSASGTVVALRTYTEAYLYRAPDGDVPAALRSKPVRIPLPKEVQGEAIAIEPDGTLLSAGEGEDQPVREVRDAVSLLPALVPRDQGSTQGKGLATGPAIVVTGTMIGVVVLGWRGVRKLRAG